MIDGIITFYNYFEQGFEFIFQHWNEVSDYFWQHIQIVGISLIIGLIIALPIGFLISRIRWLATPILGFLNILYSIPSVAFLALLVPVLGLGSINTIVALTVYAQTMLVRNTALGFNSIDASILEAARGMGMNNMQILWRVELPLATPLILAGLRITTLSNISIATIGALVGAGGLGQLILIDPTNNRQIAAAIICIIFIAVVADQLYRLVEHLVAGQRYSKISPPTSKAIKRNAPEALVTKA